MSVDKYLDVIDCVEDIVEQTDCTIFVDTCFLSFFNYFQKELAEITSYSQVSVGKLETICIGGEKMENLLKKDKVFIISEVSEEFDRGIIHFKDTKRLCEKGYSKRIPALSKKSSKIKIDLSKKDFAAKKKLFNKYFNSFKKLAKSIKLKIFDFVDSDDFEKKIRQLQINKGNKLSISPRYRGTDEKLIVAALLYESDAPVCIVTRDKGITNTLELMQKQNNNFLDLNIERFEQLQKRPIRAFYFNPRKEEYIEAAYPAIKLPEK